MSDLIPILSRPVGDEINSVDARVLHAHLGSRQDFSTWFKARVEQLGLVEGVDFAKLNDSASTVLGSANRTDYAVTIDAAKHLAMAERNARGHEARAYFIAAEKRLRAVVADPMAMLSDPATLRGLLGSYAERAEVAEGQVLLLSANLEAAEALVGEAADAVAFTSLVRADNDAEYTLTRAAGILQIQRKKLSHFLVNGSPEHETKLCYRDKSSGGDIMPKAHYKPRYFRERLHEYIDSKTGEKKTSSSLRITHEGIYWLAKRLGVTPDFDASEAAE